MNITKLSIVSKRLKTGWIILKKFNNLSNFITIYIFLYYSFVFIFIIFIAYYT